MNARALDETAIAAAAAQSIREVPLVFACEAEQLVGIAAIPPAPHRYGIVIVVGGPQYRAGSHRQFTLLARSFAQQGIATLRFDCRGMGDSSGDLRTFEDIDADIRAGIDALLRTVPSLEGVVLWGLCDGATAAGFHLPHDRRVRGIAMVNPWVRSTAGLAQTQLRNYYWDRLRDREFWRKVGAGEFDAGRALRSFGETVRAAMKGTPAGADTSENAAATANTAAPATTTNAAPATTTNNRSLIDRLGDALARFDGRVLLVLSGSDLTAQEFRDQSQQSRRWRTLLARPNVTTRELAGADHTFSKQAWRDQIALWTAAWVKTL